MSYLHERARWGSYTRPDGRSASRSYVSARQRLLEERDRCPDCKAAAELAVETSDFRPGACQCDRHQSLRY